MSELQSISLNRRELERDQAAFPIWVFGGTDKTRTRSILNAAILPHDKVIALAQCYLVLRHVNTPVQRRSNLTTGKAGLDPTDSHQDNLAMVNSSTGGCGSCDSFWLCEPALRITRLYILRANVPRSAFPVSAMLIAAARRQANASIKMASNMFTSVTRETYLSHA
ncbi:hypothetical protein EC880221_5567 [Escherichia coli 88.0221]|nr:hypothetical protein EC880221_5567 [Escherichia coli 88.0221]